jgi:tetratricopeptide (TPR) repeat protein
MPISQGDQLFLLVKSLTKSEKRSFTAFASRFQDTDGLLYVKLFEVMEKQKTLDEDILCSKLKIKDKSQFSNLKRHLYKQILASMRMAQISKNTEIQIREYLDFTDILYAKGLYLQSLKILDKAKSLAQKTKNDILYLSIVETEKNIESKHITRTGASVTNELVKYTSQISETITNSSKLSNLRILLHGYYVQYGHVQSSEEERRIVDFFETNMPDLNVMKLSYMEQVYLYQSYVWYYYILLDFDHCLEYAENWVELFNNSTEMIFQDPDLYMRGYHYLLTCTYNLGLKDKYDHYFEEISKFRKENYHRFTTNSKITSFLYVHHGRLNYYFLHQKFNDGVAVLPKTLRRMALYKTKLDPHRIMVFHFKIAWMYLMAGNPGKAVDFINAILNTEIGALREDIQTYARIMFLMAHYDLGNGNILDYLVGQARSYFEKTKQVNDLQKASLLFFHDLAITPDFEHKEVFKKFDTTITSLKELKYEKRAFLYLDITLWVNKKLKRS